ncbi:hypothetical protein VTL71DRAFT_11506, partial [Oculimacula yallundae]
MTEAKEAPPQLLSSHSRYPRLGEDFVQGQASSLARWLTDELQEWKTSAFALWMPDTIEGGLNVCALEVQYTAFQE